METIKSKKGILISIIILVAGIFSTIHFWGLDQTVGEAWESMGSGELLSFIGIPSFDFWLILLMQASVALYIVFVRRDESKAAVKMGRIGIAICIINLILSFTPVGAVAPIIGADAMDPQNRAIRKEIEAQKKAEYQLLHPKENEGYSISDLTFEKLEPEGRNYPVLRIHARINNISPNEWDVKGIRVHVYLNGGKYDDAFSIYLDEPLKSGASYSFIYDWQMQEEFLNEIDSVKIVVDELSE